MRHVLVILRRNLQNIKKSPRVADENRYGGGGNSNNNNGIFIDRSSSRGSWNGISVICNAVRAPLSLVSCFFAQPHVNGATDGVWVSTEIAQISEMNHLMVSDSMRYAPDNPSLKLRGKFRDAGRGSDSS
ncbi:hypothetical protein ES332_D07G201000v1 [Gossypium tomentosum]|uniref:Uncharacterized protein n=1 Tax=Gossypium tomentosum TaxID=34277 RepID=A0A5D2K9B6_GOSTO|nr:hypothetical protein ES332_D07G201000v1 [Gossypium tomentosum]